MLLCTSRSVWQSLFLSLLLETGAAIFSLVKCILNAVQRHNTHALVFFRVKRRAGEGFATTIFHSSCQRGNVCVPTTATRYLLGRPQMSRSSSSSCCSSSSSSGSDSNSICSGSSSTTSSSNSSNNSIRAAAAVIAGIYKAKAQPHPALCGLWVPSCSDAGPF